MKWNLVGKETIRDGVSLYQVIPGWPRDCREKRYLSQELAPYCTNPTFGCAKDLLQLYRRNYSLTLAMLVKSN